MVATDVGDVTVQTGERTIKQILPIQTLEKNRRNQCKTVLKIRTICQSSTTNELVTDKENEEEFRDYLEETKNIFIRAFRDKRKAKTQA